jgi:hypothetical protein
MALALMHLDEQTRGFMLEEVDDDVTSGHLYISPRLNARGVEEYPTLLCDAVREHADGWLANEISRRGLLNSHLERKVRGGGVTMVRVPVNAAETLAEGEFNRFYIRGLCRRAIAEGMAGVEVYRAKAVEQPRSSSQILLGTIFDPTALLNDLRSSQGVEPAHGLPSGPNSGLSVRFTGILAPEVGPLP